MSYATLAKPQLVQDGLRLLDHPQFVDGDRLAIRDSARKTRTGRFVVVGQPQLYSQSPHVLLGDPRVGQWFPQGTTLNDLAGNAPLSGAGTTNYTIDTKEPTVSSIVMSDTALKIGETSTVTITFHEAVTNFDNSDITVENGTLTAVSSSDGGVTWTATFTPTDDIEDAANVITIGTSLTDLAGNAPIAGASTGNYAIDTKEPVIASVVMSDTDLRVGDKCEAEHELPWAVGWLSMIFPSRGGTYTMITAKSYSGEDE